MALENIVKSRKMLTASIFRFSINVLLPYQKFIWSLSPHLPQLKFNGRYEMLSFFEEFKILKLFEMLSY